MQDTFNFIYNVLIFFFSTTLGVSVLSWLVEKISQASASTKDKRRKIVLDMLEETVVYVEKNFEGGAEQKAQAEKIINKRLSDNKWSKYFTADQLEVMLESVYKALKLKGVLD